MNDEQKDVNLEDNGDLGREQMVKKKVRFKTKDGWVKFYAKVSPRRKRRRL